MIGKTLAHYEITDSIGRGGMGEVFRAHDSKLGRDVAIKVLPTEMSGDPERLARFDREARTLATLQHPHVASIYGFEIVDNIRFLVMELVDGEDVSERLQQGAIPVPEVIDLAAQMAEGLTAAHAMGIMHRDLKPANLKVSAEGTLKILDFGLARTQLDEAASDPNLEHSPTITAMTQAGVILGTAAYMSPEQARGKNVDHRADIWAFGVVLFEMLTGRRLFEGETVSDTLAGVLRADVPWDALPKDTPPTLRRLLMRCLDRDPTRRLQAIGEARIALDDLKAGRTDETQPDPATAAAGATAAARASKRERLFWMGAVAVLLIAAAAAALLRPAPPEQPMIQTILLPPDGWDLAPATPLAMSPDGKQIAYMAIARPENPEADQGTQAIWIRDLDMPQARMLVTVDRDPHPFWSPDSRWLGFFSGGMLNKIEVRGGPVIPLCEGINGRGGTWSESGTIIFQRRWSEGLMRVQSGGGTSETLTTLNEEQDHVAHRWPTFLPDGRHFLFYVVSTTNPTNSEHSGIYVGSLDSEEIRMILPAESRALYAQGHLIYRAGRTLMAHPFDPSSLSLSGDPAPVATDIPGGAVSWGGAQFGVTEGGMLVHMRGSGAAQTVLTWRNREGEKLETVGVADDLWEPVLSYSGTRVAAAVGSDAGDIWIYDLARDMRTRFSFDAADDRNPRWSPDDSKVVFSSARANRGGLYVRPTTGQGKVELLWESDTQIATPTDWSPDGRLILFDRLDTGDDGYDVWMFDTETSEAGPLLEGPFNQLDATLSPDGEWLAFSSNESGIYEVYVQPFSGGQGRWMISSDGAPGASWEPRWRSDGKELFYLRGSTLMAVPVTGGESFSFGTPKVLFSVNVVSTNADYSISPDGQRILTNELPPTDISNMGAILIQNWVRALER